MQFGEDKLGEETLGSRGMEDNFQEEELTMAELLDQSMGDLQPVVKGSIIKGTLVSVGSNELLVNIGSKYEGIVRAKDLDRVEASFLEQLKVGDELPVFVMHLEDEDGYVELSLNKALVEFDWERAQQVFESGESFKGEVVSSNKGGLIVNFGAVRGFVPGSQLASGYSSRSDRSNQWGEAVGKTLWLKIIEVDRRRNRLILSERAAVEERRRQQKEELLAELKEGEVRTGRVSSLADFGAFVDLGGAEGLIHLSELAWTQISHPREVLRVGEEIDVHILSIDHDRQRIGLSLKRLQPEPWTQVIHNYQVDQVVPAVITKLTNFGAFARIDNVIEGLIHISELAHRPINHPGEVVHEGDHVEVCIISIDPDKRRMGLSLKQVTEPEIEWVEEGEAAEEEAPAAEETAAQEGEQTRPSVNASDEEEETEAVVV